MLWWYIQDQCHYVFYISFMSTILCFKHCMFCMYTHPLRKEFLYKHGYISSHCCENITYSFICNIALKGSKRGSVWLPDRRPRFYFILFYVDWRCSLLTFLSKSRVPQVFRQHSLTWNGKFIRNSYQLPVAWLLTFRRYERWTQYSTEYKPNKWFQTSYEQCMSVLGPTQIILKMWLINTMPIHHFHYISISHMLNIYIHRENSFHTAFKDTFSIIFSNFVLNGILYPVTIAKYLHIVHLKLWTKRVKC